MFFIGILWMHNHFLFNQKFFPLLSKLGSWTPKSIYTKVEIKKVIEYGRLRGIRVVPEFDTPGHSACWGIGYPQLFPNCPGQDPVFDVTSNYTYNFMKQFLGEMSDLFVDQFVHLGGDEVADDCWNADPKIKQWMVQNNITTYLELQGYYEQKVQNFVLSNNKVPAFWDEVFGDQKFPLDKRSVIFVWTDDNQGVATVVKAGYRAVFSTPWYLDRQIPGAATWWFWQDTWKNFYMADPIGDNTLTPSQAQLVLGGEASMWGEQVDATDFDVRVWPRACAVAERLWSSMSLNNTDEATPRLGQQRCRMVRRGIMAGPIYPDYCYTAEDVF